MEMTEMTPDSQSKYNQDIIEIKIFMARIETQFKDYCKDMGKLQRTTDELNRALRGSNGDAGIIARIGALETLAQHRTDALESQSVCLKSLDTRQEELEKTLMPLLEDYEDRKDERRKYSFYIITLLISNVVALVIALVSKFIL